MEKSKKQLLFAGFNQDNQCFSVGTNDGFRIYMTEPFKFNLERNLGEEISMVIMLYRTNILALVGSENNMTNKRNKLIMWDDHNKKLLSELKFNQHIMNVKLRNDKIIVVAEKKYSFLIYQILKIWIKLKQEKTPTV